MECLCISSNALCLLFGCALLLVAKPALAGASDSLTTRIVSLVPGLTETCFAIGAGEQLVGDSDYCKYPAAAQKLPHVGGLGNPRLEQLLLLRPTIVLLYQSQADFALKLRNLNIASQLFALDTISDTYAATEQLGVITGHRDSAQRLEQRLRNSLAAIHNRAARTTSPKVIVLVSRDSGELRNLYQAGPANFLGEVMTMAGGTLAIPSGAAITKEQLILANPQVILDLSGGESANNPSMAANAMKLWGSLSTVEAVRNHRVHVLSDPHMLVPGPYLLTTAETFEALLHK
jgi:iron complex transport system substrate-binding protein